MSDSITTIREEWDDDNGITHGINIRFKGGCDLVQGFEYICLSCREQVTIQHKRSDKMRDRGCTKCEGVLSRFHDKPPALDGDYHDRCRSENIGWEG